MTKFLTISTLALVLIWQSAFAVAPIPTNIISVEPLVAETGSPIKINALIYNPQKETVVFTVEFKAGEVSLGKPVATIASLGAKTVSVDWKEPKMKTDISVTIISALDKQKKDIALLHGLVGVVSIGAEEAKVKSTLSFGQGKVGGFFSSVFNTVEAFRQKQAIYFSKLRDDTKKSLGMEIKDDVIKKLSPIFSPPVTSPIIDNSAALQDDLALTNSDNPLNIYKSSDSKNYVNLILSTTMASFFGSSVFFYALSIVVLLFLIRLVFKIFS